MRETVPSAYAENVMAEALGGKNPESPTGVYDGVDTFPETPEIIIGSFATLLPVATTY